MRASNLRSVLTMALAAMVGVAHVHSAANLLPDGDFETADASGRPAGWSDLEQNKEMDLAHNRVTVDGDAYAGRGAAMIELRTLSSAFSAHPLDGLKPGRPYRLSAWVKGRLQCDNEKSKGAAILAGRRNRNETLRIGNAGDLVYGVRSTGAVPLDWTPIEMTFRAPDDPSGSWVAIAVYGGTGQVWFDALRVEEIGDAGGGRNCEDDATGLELMPGQVAKSDALEAASLAGRNFVKNGSFEISSAGDTPDAWCNGIHYPASDPDFRKNWRLVEDNPFHGRRCFLLRGTSIHFNDAGLLDKCALPGVLSLYLRSEDPQAVMSVTAMGRSQTFRPDGSWRRFVMTAAKLTSNEIKLTAQGAIYIDAVQLETGSEPAAWRSNIYEIARSVAPVAAPLPAERGASLPTSPPRAAAAWEKGRTIECLVGEGGRPAAKPTRVILVKTDDALHIRFECRGRPPAEQVAIVTNRDGLVFMDDAVAVMLTPGYRNGVEAPYGFAANCAGVKRDAWGNNLRWDADWGAQTVRLDDGYNVEFNIPFASLDDGVVWSGEWLVNLIRYSAATGRERREVTAWHYPASSVVERTGTVVAGFDGLSRYAVRLEAPHFLLERCASVLHSDAFTLVFHAGFAVPQVRQGLARLTGPGLEERTTRWESCNGRTAIRFPGISAEDICGLKTVRLELEENQQRIALRCYSPPPGTLPPMTPGAWDRNYYSTETTACLRVAANVTPELAARLEWDVNISGAAGRIFRQRYPAVNNRLEFAIAAWPAGLYKIELELTRDRGSAEALARAETTMLKLAPGAVETKYDPATRMAIVDNRPFIFFGHHLPVWMGATNQSWLIPHYLRLLREELPSRSSGVIFGLVSAAREGRYTPGQLEPLLSYLDACRQSGLQAVIWFPHAIDGAALDGQPGKATSIFALESEDIFTRYLDIVKQLQDYPGIFAWYSQDEMYGWWTKFNPQHKESEWRDFYSRLKRVDPYRLYMANPVHGGRMYGGYASADIIGGSFYNNGVSGVRGYARQMELAREAAGAHNVTGGFLYTYVRNRLGTVPAGKFRAKIYAMLAAGSRNFLCYSGKPFSMRLWDSFAGLKNELTFLAPRMAGDDVSGRVIPACRYIDVAGWKSGGKLYIISVNPTDAPVPACAFDLSLLGRATAVRDCFDDRHPALMPSGGFVDAFDSFERHVYEVTVDGL